MAAREAGLSAVGFDLSPLSVMVSNVKVASYNPLELRENTHKILTTKNEAPFIETVPERISKAFTEQELRIINSLRVGICQLPGQIRDFFLVALLTTIGKFSRAVADGGWFRWKEWPDRSAKIMDSFGNTVAEMIEDVEGTAWVNSRSEAYADLADARRLPLQSHSIDAVITSPPYANRHDYTRVFHIELLLLGETESKITNLRHSSLRSHIEARKPANSEERLQGYSEPEILNQTIAAIPVRTDQRVETLIRGYFEDLFLSLQEVIRVLRPGGKAAFVVGNVRHAGVMVPADSIFSELAQQAGMTVEATWVMRLRGNSAQQMGRFGREPSRESVVLISKDADV